MHDASLRAFLDTHIRELRPRFQALTQAWWENSTRSGPDSTRQLETSELEFRTFYSDPQAYKNILAWQKEGVVDPLLKRQAELLRLAYLENQGEDLAEMVRLGVELEGVFNTFRAELDGKKVADNELKAILRHETNVPRRKAAWEASKQIGAQVSETLRELAHLRNRHARALGYDNYFTFQFALQELDVKEVMGVFSRLHARTEPHFVAFKEELDTRLARRYGVAVEELGPWAYADPFFQEAPSHGETGLDAIFANVDPVDLVRRTYASIHLPVDDILQRSDLHAREGKCQHAFCLDLDREGDARTLVNLEPNAYWTSTLLHECGHGAYYAYLPSTLPFLLRDPAHTLTTEAVALLFERLISDPEWLAAYPKAPKDTLDTIRPLLEKSTREKMLVFTHWVLVVVSFEQELYRDPDQDLNGLWWSLVEHFQRIRPPERRDRPDWASKIHLATAPVYYQNYLLGEIMAGQLFHMLKRETGKPQPLFDCPRTGELLRERLFDLGATLRWDDTLQKATGSPLDPDPYADEFLE